MHKALLPALLFLMLALAFAAAPALLPAQPLWTDFTYTDWNPGVAPAIGVIDERHYESRTAWDGTQFVSIHEYTEPSGAKGSYWIAYSADGQTWGTPTPLPAMAEWTVGHHAVACDPNCFPAGDTMNGDTDIKFKMWYNRYSNHAYFRYAESPDGIAWSGTGTFDGVYCPPYCKVSDLPITTKFMTKPDVLYRPEGSLTLDTDNPMNNRYICFLNSNTVSGNPGFFEMYISHNGLEWTLYAWDQQRQDRWDGQPTPVPTAEVRDIITFAGGSTPSSSLHVSALEEVYQDGELQGYMLWVENGYTQIYSYYSTDGVDWTKREEPINGIGGIHSDGYYDYWNSERNYGLDAVRLGESYFFLRSGRSTAYDIYTLGAAVRKGRMSAEVETPESPASGTVLVSYRLFNWTEEVAPSALFTYSTDGIVYQAATMGAGGDGDTDLSAGIGGAAHVYAWNAAADLPAGATGVTFRVQPVPDSEDGSYGTSGAFDVTAGAPIRLNYQPPEYPAPPWFPHVDTGGAYGDHGWASWGWR